MERKRRRKWKKKKEERELREKIENINESDFDEPKRYHVKDVLDSLLVLMGALIVKSLELMFEEWKGILGVKKSFNIF